MKKCKLCGKTLQSGNAYQHYDGGYVCNDCIGHYFTCPDCGRLFDQDDFENGDQGTGFCIDCSPNH